MVRALWTDPSLESMPTAGLPNKRRVEHPGEDRFEHHATVELLEVEELPPLWSTDEVRFRMSKRFKLEGNEKFAVGDYVRSVRPKGSGK